ncbi:unnamed protein product, partial [Owenia fusiformis]
KKEMVNTTLPLNNSFQNEYFTDTTPSEDSSILGIRWEDNIRPVLRDRLEFSRSIPNEAVKIWQYFSPIILILGTLGNIFSTAILSRKNMRKMIMSKYLIMLAIVDMMALWNGLFTSWLQNAFGKNILIYHTTICKTLTFLVYVFAHLSPWILVCVTFERFVAVFVPLKVNILCQMKTTIATLVVLSITIIGLNLHIFWTYGIYKNNVGKGTIDIVCEQSTDFKDLYNKYWVWIDATIASYLPFIIMFISNMAIIARLVLRNAKGIGNNLKTTAMTVTLVLCNFMFILCTLPIVLLMIFKNQWYPERKNIHSPDFVSYSKHWAISNMFYYINHAINFLLYCIAGPVFRREIKNMVSDFSFVIKCSHICRKTNTVGISDGQNTNDSNV